MSDNLASPPPAVEDGAAGIGVRPMRTSKPRPGASYASADAPGPTALATALWFLGRGQWPVLIYPYDSKLTTSPGKAPIGKSWGAERHDAEWWRSSLKRYPKAGVGLKLGAEGGVIDIDVDDPEAARPVLARIFPDGLPETMGWSNAGGRFHLLFRWDDRLARYGKAIIKGQRKDDGKVIGNPEYLGVEIRIGAAEPGGKQYQSVIPPSLMANAAARRWNGVWEILPAPECLLADLDAHAMETPAAASPSPPASLDRRPRKGGTTNQGDTVRDRARKYLDACEPAVSGESGHDRTYKIAANLGPGFDLAPDVALALMRDVFNPRCVPPWSDAELRHKVDDAYAKEPRRGWLLETPPNGKAARIGRDGASEIPPDNGASAPPRPGDPDPPVNEAPDDPHRLARAVLADYLHPEGYKLAWHREEFHVWKGAAFRPHPDFQSRLVKLVKSEVDRGNREAIAAYREHAAHDAISPSAGRPARPPVAARVTRRLVSDVTQALGSEVCIDSEAEAPFWIERRPTDPEPTSLMPAANGLVHLDARGGPALLPHSPRLFTNHALPYAFRPDAPEPTAWLKFLSDLWPDDPASVRELRKWFGYVLTPETNHQKILLLIGSPGSGRSTLKNVMTEVVGPKHVASTSAVALADRFGLEPLTGKTLAILGDARTGDTHDTAVMLDRLLRISGEDKVEVNRKGKTILHDVRLRTRIVILSNELPNFRDSSRAIVRRYLPICTPRSFEERADPDLLPKLLAELPGILNWAIEGRAMLANDGRFIVPPSAEDLIEDARALASPAAEFVAEECDLGTGHHVTVETLWLKWTEWAEKNGHQRGHRHLFGRNLKAATGYRIKTTRPRSEDARFRVYEGIGLRLPPDTF